MAELEPDLARAVSALRAKRSPPPGAEQRIHAAVAARVGTPGPDDGGLGQGGGGGSGVQATFAAKVVGATAGLTAGGLLVVKLAVLTVRSLTPAAPPEAAAIEAREPSPTVTAEVEPPVPEPVPAPDVDAIEAAPSPEASPSRGGASKPTPLAKPQPDITAELALIEAARAASNPDAAIARLREHARQFPTGTLADEREALWAIADCEREAFDEAERRATSLAERRPHSPLLDRIAKACPDLKK